MAEEAKKKNMSKFVVVLFFYFCQELVQTSAQVTSFS